MAATAASSCALRDLTNVSSLLEHATYSVSGRLQGMDGMGGGCGGQGKPVSGSRGDSCGGE